MKNSYATKSTFFNRRIGTEKVVGSTFLGISGGYFIGRLEVHVNGISQPQNAWDIKFNHTGKAHLIAIGPEDIEKMVGGLPVVSTVSDGLSLIKKLILKRVF